MADTIPVLYDFQVRNVDSVTRAFRKIEKSMDESTKKATGVAAKATGSSRSDAKYNEQLVREYSKIKDRQFKEEQKRIKKLAEIERKEAERTRKQEEAAKKKAHDAEMARIKAEGKEKEKNARRAENNARAAAKQSAAMAAREDKDQLRRLRLEERARLAPRYAARRAVVGGAFDLVGDATKAAATFGVGAVTAGAAVTAHRAMSQEQLSMQIVANAYNAEGWGVDKKAAEAKRIRGMAVQQGRLYNSDPMKVLEGMRSAITAMGDTNIITENADVFGAMASVVDDPAALGQLVGGMRQLYGKNLDMRKALGGIYYSGKTGAMEISDFATHGMPMLAAHRAAGFGGTGEQQLQDVSAFAQYARKTGGSSAETATSIRNIITGVVAHEKELKDKFGMNIRDKNGNMLGLQEILVELMGRGAGYKDLQELFNIRGAKGTNAMLNQAQEIQKDIAGKGMKGDVAWKEYVRRMNAEIDSSRPPVGTDTWKGVTEHAAFMGTSTEAQLSGILTRLDEAFGPQLVKVVKDFTDLLIKFSESGIGQMLKKATDYALESPGNLAGVAAGGWLASRGTGALWDALKKFTVEKVGGYSKLMNVTAGVVNVTGGGGGLPPGTPGLPPGVPVAPGVPPVGPGPSAGMFGFRGLGPLLRGFGLIAGASFMMTGDSSVNKKGKDWRLTSEMLAGKSPEEIRQIASGKMQDIISGRAEVNKEIPLRSGVGDSAVDAKIKSQNLEMIRIQQVMNEALSKFATQVTNAADTINSARSSSPSDPQK